MSKSFPIVFKTNAFQLNNGPYSGNGFIFVNPQETSLGYTYRTGWKEPVYNWAVVLDRKDPTQPALFNDALASSTDVPGALATAVEGDSILFFLSAGYASQVPQGALFTFLQNNGAGANLHKLERYAYFSGCGMSWSGLYCLVSVPGSGLPGIEYAKSAEVSYTLAPDSSRSSVVVGFDIFLDMVPSADGYVPVEVGTSD